MATASPVLRLASVSPRRRELLTQIGVSHLITGAHIEQHYGAAHQPMNYVPLNQRYGVQMRYVF